MIRARGVVVHMRTDQGPTPGGGDRAVARFFDAAGDEVDTASEATTVEITEFRHGRAIKRTLGAVGGGPAPRTPEDGMFTAGDPDVPESVKDTWDVWVTDDSGQMRLASTVEEMLRATGANEMPLAEQRQYVGAWMTQASYGAAPQELKDDADRWLVGTRPTTGGAAPA
jgi:hypothetical protein